MDDEQLLIEIDDLLRTMPPRETMRHENAENIAWLGRAAAIIDNAAGAADQVSFRTQLGLFQTVAGGREASGHFRQVLMMLHKVRASLMMRTRGPLTAAVAKGMVYDYFDEIRKIVETAKQDILFVDPYLDAEFVARYLPHVTAGVSIRLLAREKIQTLMPAVRQYVAQTGVAVEVRSTGGFHDRYVFIDRVACYQSGASFKDGAKAAPTTLTQITDAFAAMLTTYEQMWGNAQVVN